MNRSELIFILLKLDLKLAVNALKNETLNARLKVQQLLKEIQISVQSDSTTETTKL